MRPQEGPTQTCEWDDCGTQHSARELMVHIAQTHATSEGEQQCQWGECTQMEPSHYALVHHLRHHVRHTPFKCIVPDCQDEFINADQLQVHLTVRHEEHKDNKLQWFTFLDKLKNSHPLFDTRPQDNLTRVTDREFQRLLNSRKIDFLKVSNVSLDDIVSEPSRKKGRTANAEINADLREQYRVENTAFKDALMQRANSTFEQAQQVGPLPLDKEIDTLAPTELEQLHQELERRWLWTLEASQLLKAQVLEVEQHREQLTTRKELLLDATIALELPAGVDKYTMSS